MDGATVGRGFGFNSHILELQGMQDTAIFGAKDKSKRKKS